MLANDLKTYIVNNNLIIPLLEKLKFSNIKVQKYKNEDWIFCAWGDSDLSHGDGNNRSAVQIKCLDLFVRTFTHVNLKGDIYSLVMYLRDSDFMTALKTIHELLDIQFIKQYKEQTKKIDILGCLTKYKTKTYKNNEPIKTYPLSILDNYDKHIHMNWVKEGITPKVAERFDIGFDWQSQRITIPYKSLDISDNAIVGIEGRSLLDHETCQQFDIPKYFPLVKYEKSRALFGYIENYKYIQQCGYVVVVESAKSVLKRASLNDNTCVALGGHNLSCYQLEQLLGLNVDIVICMDKNVSEKEVKLMCDKFNAYRNVYYMIDKDNLIGERDSPCDRNEAFVEIFNKKIKYIKETVVKS